MKASSATKLRASCSGWPSSFVQPGMRFRRPSRMGEGLRGGVDDQCVERALQSVSPKVSRTYYNSRGDRGFPSGTEVTQFNYPDPVTHNDYSLDLAILANGKTHYVHRWTKIGTEIPDAEQAKVFPLLLQANEAVESACGLPFAGSKPTVGPGNVRFPPIADIQPGCAAAVRPFSLITHISGTAPSRSGSKLVPNPALTTRALPRSRINPQA